MDINNITVILIVLIIALSMITSICFLVYLSKSIKDTDVHFENGFEVNLTEGKVKSNFRFDCDKTKERKPGLLESKDDGAENKKENDKLVCDSHLSSSKPE